MQRYKQLLFFATKLEPLPADEHTQENKVQGCVSQVCVLSHTTFSHNFLTQISARTATLSLLCHPCPQA